MLARDYKVLTVRVPLPVFRRFKRYLAGLDRSAQDELLSWIDQMPETGGGEPEAPDPFEGGLRNRDVVKMMENERRRELKDDGRWVRTP